MKNMNNLDYVELYAAKLKNDNRLFAQQKKLLESQLQGSSSLFKRMISSYNFKNDARKYLRGVGLL